MISARVEAASLLTDLGTKGKKVVFDYQNIAYLVEIKLRPHGSAPLKECSSDDLPQHRTL